MRGAPGWDVQRCCRSKTHILASSCCVSCARGTIFSSFVVLSSQLPGASPNPLQPPCLAFVQGRHKPPRTSRDSWLNTERCSTQGRALPLVAAGLPGSGCCIWPAADGSVRVTVSPAQKISTFLLSRMPLSGITDTVVGAKPFVLAACLQGRSVLLAQPM